MVYCDEAERRTGNDANYPQPFRPGAYGSATLICAGILVLLCDLPAPAQETSPDTAESGEQLVAPEQVVDVEERVDDADIVSRLTDILVSTGRFIDPEVRVENGVVFLSGITRKTEHRDWARQLALKTEDVVAVVNNISFEPVEESLWDFSPACTEVRKLGREAMQTLPLIVLGTAILLFTLLLGRIANKLAQPILRKKVESAILRDVLNKTLLVFVGIIGLYLFLRVSGLTRLALAMLSGTGVLGLLIGFAFRDIAENFLASVLISIQRPFRVGDTIEVDGHTGIVQKVTTRGTVLMAFDGNYIQIVNSTIYKSTIRNFTANPNLRLDFAVGIGYDATLSEAQSVILKILESHAAVLKEPEPKVLVEELGASTINLRVYFWIDCHEHSNVKVLSSVLRSTLAALMEAGISMPDDAREVVFPDGVPVISMDQDQRKEESERRKQESAEKGRMERASATAEIDADLESEVDELNAQARASHLPEEGRDLLADDEGNNVTGGV